MIYDVSIVIKIKELSLHTSIQSYVSKNQNPISDQNNLVLNFFFFLTNIVSELKIMKFFQQIILSAKCISRLELKSSRSFYKNKKSILYNGDNNKVWGLQFTGVVEWKPPDVRVYVQDM